MDMKRTSLAALFFGLGFALVVVGCHRDDDSASAKLDRVAGSVDARLDDAADAVGDGIDDAADAVGDAARRSADATGDALDSAADHLEEAEAKVEKEWKD